jgi:hypothetical protein
MLRINEYFMLYLKFQIHRKITMKESIKNNTMKFQHKQQLAMELISEFTPATQTNYLLIDSWYTSANILIHGLVNGCHCIGRIKSNRVIYPAGIKVGFNKFSTYIKSNETSLVTASNNKYYVYRYEGKLNDMENALYL